MSTESNKSWQRVHLRTEHRKINTTTVLKTKKVFRIFKRVLCYLFRDLFEKTDLGSYVTLMLPTALDSTGYYVASYLRNTLF